MQNLLSKAKPFLTTAIVGYIGYKILDALLTPFLKRVLPASVASRI